VIVAASLIGRDRMVSGILAALDDAVASRRSSAVALVGEPGIGKTSVLRAVVEQVEQSWTVLRVGSTAAEQRVSWSGLGALLHSLPTPLSDEWQGADPSGRAALDAAMGADPSGAPHQSAISPMVAAAVRGLLRLESARRPVLLAIDDVHWLDPATAAAMSAALRTSNDLPVAVLATARPLLELPIDLHRLFVERCVQIDVGELQRADVHELLRRRGVTVTTEMLDRVWSLGRGNPLHTELLAAQVTVDGHMPERVPRSIAALYGERVERLDPTHLRVLEHAAVLGAVEPAVLRACLADDIDAALIAGERSGLLSSHGSRAVTFSHPLVAATLVDSMPAAWRAQVNLALAEAITDPERSAVHLAASAAQPDAAVAAALDAAAVKALDRGARATAGERFRRAAELTPPDNAADRWRRLLTAADAFVGSANLAAAHDLSVEAFELASDPMQLALAGGVRTQLLAASGDILGTHRFVVELLDRLQGWPMLRGFLGRAKVRLEQIVDLHQALATAEGLRSEMQAAGLTDLATEFHIAAENCRFVIGQPVDARALWTAAEPQLDVDDFIGAGWMAIEVLVWAVPDVELVESALAVVDRGATASGAMQSLAKLYDFRANFWLRVGRWREAEDEFRRAVDATELSQLAGATSHAGLSWVLAATGQIDEARRVLAGAIGPDATEELPLLHVAQEVAAGFVALCAADWELAATHLHAAWASADKLGMGDLCGLPFRADLVEALVQCGRHQQAAERSQRITELATGAGTPEAMVQAYRAEVVVAGAQGRFDDALAATERALAVHRSGDFPSERARLQLAAGSAMRRAGRRSMAAELLDEALATFTLLGARPFAERARAELDRLGTRRGSATELTATEAQIAALVAQGRANTEVAAELNVSVRTVESNLTRIYRKLDVRSRAQLAAAYRDR
jgi:DNA-binding NarL/FixJ family response regulator/DNA replicative helicase MCM subunit Mcm2 (Cdc46/Mcm family)